MLRAFANTNVHWDCLRKESSQNNFPNSFDHKRISSGAPCRTVFHRMHQRKTHAEAKQKVQAKSVYVEGTVAENTF